MKTLNVGIELIKKYEGCILKSYKCPSGVWTIGYGHTNGVKSGMQITKAQALDYLKQDLITFEKTVTNYVKVLLNQNQFNALVSFSFNCGSGASKTCTLLKKLNSSDYNGAANELHKWNKSNCKVLNGLVRRRQEEKELFLKTNYLSNKSYKGISLVDALKQIKVDASFSNRKRLAKNNGISNYSGTYSQNLKLLNLLKQGKLIHA
jgi:lysozyme